MLTFHFAAQGVDTQVCTTRTQTPKCNNYMLSGLYLGVVTFCHSSATPCAAEEGLTGVLGEGREDSVGCHAQWKDFTAEEVGSTELAPLLSHIYPVTFRLTQLHTCTVSLVPRPHPPSS